ncbi:hypothetical protein NPIL_202241, partial [Nephila pilipes]
TAGDCLPGPVSKHRLSLPKELSREAYSGLDDCSEASLLWSVAPCGVSVPFPVVLLGSA